MSGCSWDDPPQCDEHGGYAPNGWHGVGEGEPCSNAVPLVAGCPKHLAAMTSLRDFLIEYGLDVNPDTDGSLLSTIARWHLGIRLPEDAKA